MRGRGTDLNWASGKVGVHHWIALGGRDGELGLLHGGRTPLIASLALCWPLSSHPGERVQVVLVPKFRCLS